MAGGIAQQSVTPEGFLRQLLPKKMHHICDLVLEERTRSEKHRSQTFSYNSQTFSELLQKRCWSKGDEFKKKKKCPAKKYLC